MDDWDAGAPAINTVDAWVLADTGATHSGLDTEVCSQLSLLQQGLVSVLFPQSPHTEIHPTFPAALSFFGSATDTITSPWHDAVPFMSLSLRNRSFTAVLGMDVLRQGNFAIQKSGSVTFEF